jgi:hypothetical protein
LASPKVIAPRLKALIRNPLLPYCLCSIAHLPFAAGSRLC